jgi:hypothetical protein
VKVKTDEDGSILGYKLKDYDVESRFKKPQKTPFDLYPQPHVKTFEHENILLSVFDKTRKYD